MPTPLYTADIDEIAKAIVNTLAVTISDPLVPAESSKIKPFPYIPAALDTVHLPALYLWAVGDGIPDLSEEFGHSTARGTFVRDFEFHLATATINQQNDPARNTTSRKILSYVIEAWLTNPDLKDENGDYVPFVQDWWYTRDRGIAILREYSQSYMGSILTFRVRYLWKRPN